MKVHFNSAPVQKERTQESFFIRADDERVKAHQADLKKAKAAFVKKPGGHPKDRFPRDPTLEGVKLGKAIAGRSGPQFVLVGESHRHVAQWDVIVGIMRGLKESKNLDKKRQIIFVQEIRPDQPTTSKAFKEWNEGQSGTKNLGTSVAGQIKISEWEKLFWPKNPYDPNRWGYSLPAALSKMSKLFPAMKAYNIDLNYNLFTENTSQNLTEFTDRDTAMALRLRELAAQYPDAIFVGRFGFGHLPETQEDKPGKECNIGANGLNLNDPLGEQLALLYGGDNVHTIAVLERAIFINYDNEKKPVYKNSGQIDAVIRVKPIDYNKPWHRSWADKK